MLKLQFSKNSYGSEGEDKRRLEQVWLQFSKNSYGSEGCVFALWCIGLLVGKFNGLRHIALIQIRSFHGPWLLKSKVQMNWNHIFVIRDKVKISQ